MAVNEIEVIDLLDTDTDSEKDQVEIIEIEDDLDSTDNIQPSYYQRAFISILSAVIDVYQVILTQEELKVLRTLLDSLSPPAQRLFIRLILRKAGWHRFNKLVYEDITNIKSAANELETNQLCQIDSDEFLDYLKLLTFPELKLIATSKLFLKLPNSSTQKDELIKLILESRPSNQQRLVFSSSLKSTSVSSYSKLDIFKQFAGKIIKIQDQIRILIDTVISLYFLVSPSNQESNFSTAILVEINRISYPKYKIIRTCPIFKSRQEYLNYQVALELEIFLKTSVDEGTPIFEHVDQTVISYKNCLQTCDMERSYFLRRFTDGWVYCRVLEYFATTFESSKKYTEAVEIYQLLINQKLFSLGHRGRWWERLIIDTSKHLKDTQKALELCECALDDSWVRTSALTSIKRRLKRIKKSDDQIGEDDDYEILTLKGRIQKGNVTGKKVKLHLDGDDLSLGSVEEFVLNEFSHDNWDGIHSESSYFTTIFALMFWDLLFHIEVPDVFQTAYQTAPLDLTTDAFFPFRRKALEDRLDLIEQNFEDSLNLLRKHHMTHHRIACVGVNWNDYSGEEGIEMLVRIARGIGGMALSLILRQFCEDYRHNRSGMPDLILWRVNDSPSDLIEHANGVIFVEVKSPNDRLSDAQRHWFSVLKNGGLRVVLARVLEESDENIKSIRKKSRPE